jgi:tellurite resistance protein
VVAHELEDGIARVCLRAIATCARADGELSDEEHELIGVIADVLGVTPIDARALEPIEPEELALRVTEPSVRARVVQAMILTSLVDGEVALEEAACVKRFAAALGVDEPRVHNLRQLAAGRLRLLWLDLARRSFARPIFEKAFRERGLRGLFAIVGPMLGLGGDAALVARYRALGELPEGTLGQAYFRFIVANELGFPGEGPVAEDGVWHDLTHVLAGYGTDPLGEIDVVSFIAGYAAEDPFFWLFTITLQFHLGIKVSPYSPGLVGRVDPARVARAFARGRRCRRDLSAGWDFWPELSRPLEDVRRELGIEPA